MEGCDSLLQVMFKAKLTDRATQVRFLRFVTSGMTVMAVQIGGLMFFSQWWTAVWSFTASYAVAIVTHYCLNRFWALRSNRTDVIKQGGEYALTVAASFVANFALFQIATCYFSLLPVVAAVVTNPPTTIIVFLVLNYRVFRA